MGEFATGQNGLEQSQNHFHASLAPSPAPSIHGAYRRCAFGSMAWLSSERFTRSYSDAIFTRMKRRV